MASYKTALYSFNKTFPDQVSPKGLGWPYKNNVLGTLVSFEMNATFQLYCCLFCYRGHGSSHRDSCLHRSNHLCVLCNAARGYSVCLLGRDENSAWLYAVMMVHLDATGSLKTGYNYDYVTELMGEILIDQDVENQISRHMTSVSKRCSSLLVSENFLEKRKISELSVVMESCYPQSFHVC